MSSGSKKRGAAALDPTPTLLGGEYPTLVMDNGAASIKIGFASKQGVNFESSTSSIPTTLPWTQKNKDNDSSVDIMMVDEGGCGGSGRGKNNGQGGTSTPTPPPPPVVTTSTNRPGNNIHGYCRILPNCVSKAKSERRRPFISAQIDECRDTSGLFFILPFTKGYMNSPDTQKTVWDYVFGPECLQVSCKETNLLVTEPILNFTSAQDVMCELLFEEYEFNGVSRTTAPHLADYNFACQHPASASCTIVVDSGFSFTHVIPFVNGRKVTEAIRRIDVGGKALTNQLKELISYRQIHVLDETYLMNQVKEDVCYVSTDFMKDLEIAKKKHPLNNIIKEYVLPDYTTIRRGYVRSAEEFGKKLGNSETTLLLNNERFCIPEMLFHPSDVGINQIGISDTIDKVIGNFPETMQANFYRNIILTGGNTSMPGFGERVFKDVRSCALDSFDVAVHTPWNPTTYAWSGGVRFALNQDFPKYMVSRLQYLEYGLSAFERICDIA